MKLLTLVDRDVIAVNTGATLSHLPQELQITVLAAMQTRNNNLTMKKADRLKALHKEEKLNEQTIYDIVTGTDLAPPEKISFALADFQVYFPHDWSPERIRDEMLKMVKERPAKPANRCQGVN